MKHLRVQAWSLGVLLSALALGNSYAATATRTSSFEYDAATGLLLKEVIEPDNVQLRLETTYTHDAYGNKTAATVSSPATGIAAIAPRTSSSTYDARGQFPTQSTNALGHAETKVIDPKFGTVTSLTGPNGLTTQWQYDSFGRKTLETRADGTKTQWTYLYCNGVNGGTTPCPSLAKYLVQVTPLSSSSVANGPWTKAYYDALNREIRTETQGFDGTSVIVKSTEYDSLGRIYRTSRPYYSTQTPQWTVMTYDALGRAVGITAPDNTQVTTTYSGLSVTTKNALNQTQTKIKNAVGELAQVIDAANNSITYQYDPFGNLLKTTDPKGNTTTLVYDIRGRKTQMSDPNMGTWSYTYNALGELVRQIDAKTQVSTMAYDKLGRMTTRSEPDLISTWTYDNCTKGVGKLCQAASDNGYLAVTNYDSLGRAASTATTKDGVYNASVAYDAHGRVASQIYPTGFAVKHVYTALGYLKEVRNNASNVLYWRADVRDAEGHLLQQTYGNNVVTTQVFDAKTGRTAAIRAGAGNGVQNLTYGYDNLGNLLSRSDANQSLSETFLYDSLNRLTTSTVNSSGAGVVNQTYAYDSIGNITSRSDVGAYTYGAVNSKPHAVNQIAWNGGGKRTYAYDANGNMTLENHFDANGNALADKTRQTVYTSFNMPQAMGTATASLAFIYGPDHQRIQQLTPTALTTYLHPDNAGGLFYEKDVRNDASSTVEHRHFISAGGQVVALAKQINGVTTVIYFHRDYLGSTTAITNEAGAVIERLAYEPFGRRRFANGVRDANGTIVGINTDRGYTNHEHLDELGLIHMNGRIYDPVLARFMSADPVVDAPDNLQSYNRYAYVTNSPFLYTDPSGFSRWTKIRSIVTRVVAAVADAYGCSGYCSTAVGAYQGYKSGGGAGAVIGGVGGYLGYQYSVQYPMSDVSGTINWANVGVHASLHAATGCASAAAGGGNCGRGALAGAVGTIGSTYGFVGSVISGCAAGRIGGGRCADGVYETVANYAVYSAVRYTIDAFSIDGILGKIGPNILVDNFAGGCSASNYMNCAMGDRESKEWKSDEMRLKSGIAAGADAIDKGASLAAMLCVSKGHGPCAGTAGGIALAAKGISYALNPPGQRELAMDTTLMVIGPSVDSFFPSRPAIWFAAQVTFMFGSELAKPYLKAEDAKNNRK